MRLGRKPDLLFQAPGAVKDRATECVYTSYSRATIQNDVPHDGNGSDRGGLWSGKERSLSERQSLVETLRTTSAVLLGLRKAIGVSGHLDTMTDIDTLLAVAQGETNRRITMADLTSGLMKE